MQHTANNSFDWLDVAYKCAIVVIAFSNFLVAVFVFRFKNSKEDKERVEKHNVDLYKEIVLKPNAPAFFTFVKSLMSVCEDLLSNGQTIDQKKSIQEKIDLLFVDVRTDFIDLFSAFDEKLKDRVQNLFDEMQTHLTESIFDEGINLGHRPKYEEKIKDPISYFKTDIIKILISYTGATA